MGKRLLLGTDSCINHITEYSDKRKRRAQHVPLVLFRAIKFGFLHIYHTRAFYIKKWSFSESVVEIEDEKSNKINILNL